MSSGDGFFCVGSVAILICCCGASARGGGSGMTGMRLFRCFGM